MPRSDLTGVCSLLLALMLATAGADPPVMPRQAVKGTLIVVSNLDRDDYEDLLVTLGPQYVYWVEPTARKQDLVLPPTQLALILFLLRTSPQMPSVDASWLPELPIALEELTPDRIVLAAKRVQPPGNVPWYADMVIAAPTERLMDAAIKEALTLEKFPLQKPVIHQVVDLRRVRAVACLPSVTPDHDSRPVGEAAEGALYRGLLSLRAFQVIGREALPIAESPRLATRRSIQELGRDLGVQALAFVHVTEAATRCREHIEYATTDRKAVSAERQRAYDEERARLEAQGKKPRKSRPDPDLVWAAPYRVFNYVTTVKSQVKLVDTEDGSTILAVNTDGQVETEQEEQPRSSAYAWYKIREIESSDSARERTYDVRLRTEDAAAVAETRTRDFIALLESRAILPGLGEEGTAVVSPVPTGARVVRLERDAAFIDLGRQAGVREGDTFSLWADRELRDPDTGELIETVRTRVARLKVTEVYEKTSRCEIMFVSDDTTLAEGDVLTPDR